MGWWNVGHTVYKACEILSNRCYVLETKHFDSNPEIWKGMWKHVFRLVARIIYSQFWIFLKTECFLNKLDMTFCTLYPLPHFETAMPLWCTLCVLYLVGCLLHVLPGLHYVALPFCPLLWMFFKLYIEIMH